MAADHDTAVVLCHDYPSMAQYYGEIGHDHPSMAITVRNTMTTRRWQLQ